MRILFPYVGDTFGGSHRSSLLLVEALENKAGYKASVVIHRSGGLFAEYLARHRYEYEVLSDFPFVDNEYLGLHFLKMLRVAVPLASYLRDKSIDVVHANDRRMHLTWLLATRLCGAKFIWHQRNPVCSRRISIYAGWASEVITISNYCKRSFLGPMRKRATVVANPIFLRENTDSNEAFRQVLTNELGVKSDVFIVSWVANFVERKRPLDFVNFAKAMIDRTDRQIIFLMFGEPREPIVTEVVSEIEERGLENYVRVMGVRTPIEPVLQSSDLFVATGEREGHGRTLVESMLVRTPVIATAHGGHLDIMRGDRVGWLVPVGDVEAMSDAAMQVLEGGSDVERRVNEGERWASGAFTLESHVDSILRIYNRVF